MNVIIVSGPLARSKPLSFSGGRLAALIAAWFGLPLLLAAGLFYLALFHAADIRLPFVQSLLLSAQQEQAAKNRAYLQDNVNTMAVRIGQLQAQVVRLEALGERLAKLAGLGKGEFNFDAPPGRGGPERVAKSSLSSEDLRAQLDVLSRQVDHRADQLTVLESILLPRNLARLALPAGNPLSGAWSSSAFGWRLDPFTGQQAFHEGVDFNGPVGTPIFAAAGGVVLASEYHSGYGNMLDVDHGDGLVTRYAHASRLLVEKGDVVRKGQKIAELGNTGRSTGPHLHFEVRYQGTPQNPVRYMQGSN